MENFYIKKNPDWKNKTKYGYVNGDNVNLVNRLNDSKEEHSELSEYTNIFVFEKKMSINYTIKKLTKQYH